MLFNVSGCRTSNMAAAKLGMEKSQLVDIIKTKFQRQIVCFRGWGTQLNINV